MQSRNGRTVSIPRGPYKNVRWAPYVRSHGSGQGQLPCEIYRPPGRFWRRTPQPCDDESRSNPRRHQDRSAQLLSFGRRRAQIDGQRSRTAAGTETGYNRLQCIQRPSEPVSQLSLTAFQFDDTLAKKQQFRVERRLRSLKIGRGGSAGLLTACRGGRACRRSPTGVRPLCDPGFRHVAPQVQ